MNNELDTPRKYQIFVVLILYLAFAVMFEAIWIFIGSDSNLWSLVDFMLMFLLLLFLGVMAIMILSNFTFHIDLRIKEGKAYFNDKESYRQILLVSSFTGFLLILFYIGYKMIIETEFASSYYKTVGRYGIFIVFAWVFVYWKKQRKRKNTL